MLRINRRKGFTLIELLVVMAIILILAGLLTPGLFRARQQAGKVSCANNMKQIGAAIELYAGNNNGTYPTTAAQIGTALDDTSVLNCPAAGGAYGFVAAALTQSTASNVVTGSCPNTGSVHGAGAQVQLYKGGYVRVR